MYVLIFVFFMLLNACIIYLSKQLSDHAIWNLWPAIILAPSSLRWSQLYSLYSFIFWHLDLCSKSLLMDGQTDKKIQGKTKIYFSPPGRERLSEWHASSGKGFCTEFSFPETIWKSAVKTRSLWELCIFSLGISPGQSDFDISVLDKGANFPLEGRESSQAYLQIFAALCVQFHRCHPVLYSNLVSCICCNLPSVFHPIWLQNVC